MGYAAPDTEGSSAETSPVGLEEDGSRPARATAASADCTISTAVGASAYRAELLEASFKEESHCCVTKPSRAEGPMPVNMHSTVAVSSGSASGNFVPHTGSSPETQQIQQRQLGNRESNVSPPKALPTCNIGSTETVVETEEDVTTVATEAGQTKAPTKAGLSTVVSLQQQKPAATSTCTFSGLRRECQGLTKQQRAVFCTGGCEKPSSSSSLPNRKAVSSSELDAVVAAAALALELERDPAISGPPMEKETTAAMAARGERAVEASLREEYEALLGEAGTAAAAELVAQSYRHCAPGHAEDTRSSSNTCRDATLAEAATTAAALAAVESLERSRNQHSDTAGKLKAKQMQEQLQQQKQQGQPPQQPEQRHEARHRYLEKQKECLRLLLLTGCLNPHWKTYKNPQAFQ